MSRHASLDVDELVLGSAGIKDQSGATVATLAQLEALGNLSVAQLVALLALSTTESGYLDGVTAGQVTASKALVADANKVLAGLTALIYGANGEGGVPGYIRLRDGQDPGTYKDFTYARLAALVAAAIEDLTASAAELNVLDGAGTTVVASKAVLADGDKDIVGLRQIWLGQNGATGFAGQINVQDGANPGASAAVTYAALKKLLDITATAGELNLLDAVVATATIALGAAGGGAQTATVTLKDAAGVAIAAVRAFHWMVEDDGAAPDGVAQGAKGTVVELIANNYGVALTDPNGECEIVVSDATAGQPFTLTVFLPFGIVQSADIIPTPS